MGQCHPGGKPSRRLILWKEQDFGPIYSAVQREAELSKLRVRWILDATRHAVGRSRDRRPWGRVARQRRADRRCRLGADRCWHVRGPRHRMRRARGRRIVNSCRRGGCRRGCRRVVAVCGSVGLGSNDDGARAERDEHRCSAEQSKTHKTVGHAQVYTGRRDSFPEFRPFPARRPALDGSRVPRGAWLDSGRPCSQSLLAERRLLQEPRSRHR